MPFDGLTVELPGVSAHVLSGHGRVTRQDVDAALAPLPRFRKLVHNLAVLRTDSAAYDPGDTATWARIEGNVRAFARAVRARGGFDGIFVDTEHYGNTPSFWSSRDPRTLDGLTRRGAQVARALGDEWPGAALLTTYGPWVGDPLTASTGLAGTDYNDVSAVNAGMGSFVAGVALGSAQAHLSYVDGGELYGLHSSADFARAYRWLKHGLARPSSPVVPPSLVPRWAASVSVGFGVYDRDVRAPGGPAVDPATWRTRLTAALRASDRYVWTYSDHQDWLGTQPDRPAPPQAMFSATRQARQDAAGHSRG